LWRAQLVGELCHPCIRYTSRVTLAIGRKRRATRNNGYRRCRGNGGCGGVSNGNGSSSSNVSVGSGGCDVGDSKRGGLGGRGGRGGCAEV